jgi:hypothetical protein
MAVVPGLVQKRDYFLLFGHDQVSHTRYASGDTGKLALAG